MKALFLVLSLGCLALAAKAQPRVHPADSLCSFSDTRLALRMGEEGMTADGAASMLFMPLLPAVDTSGINSGRLWLVGGGLAAANAGIMAYYFTTYYGENSKTTKWHTFNDWYNWDLNVDKLGHVWATQMYSRTLARMFRWTGMSEPSSAIWGAGVGLLFQFEMENTDAMYKDWGFSWIDMGANTLGAIWPVLQQQYPALRSVNLKMWYRPSRLLTQHWVNYVLKDYEGFKYWLTLSLWDVLPASLKPYWPSWLGIAVGYGAQNTMLGKNTYHNRPDNIGLGDQEWYLALDYDLRKLPGDTPLLRFLKEELNLFHLPAPAIRFTPSTVFFGLYF